MAGMASEEAELEAASEVYLCALCPGHRQSTHGIEIWGGFSCIGEFSLGVRKGINNKYSWKCIVGETGERGASRAVGRPAGA